MRTFLIVVMVTACAPDQALEYDEPTKASSRTLHAEDAAPTPTSRTAPIDWSGTQSAPRLAQSVTIHSNVDLPVLLLEHPHQSLVSDSLWYTATYAFPEYNVVVEGKRIAFDDQVHGEFQSPTRNAPRLTSTHGILDATFVEWGASYTVSFECNNPDVNPICRDNITILSTVGDLRLADSPALRRKAP